MDNILDDDVWFAVEAYFHLIVFMNEQNWQDWGTKNPFSSEVKPLHSSKVTVWAAIRSKGIIGRFFKHGTVNTDSYVSILEQFVTKQQSVEQQLLCYH